MIERALGTSPPCIPELAAWAQARKVDAGLFGMTLIGHGRWQESDTHPATQARIDAVLKTLEEFGLPRIS